MYVFQIHSRGLLLCGRYNPKGVLEEERGGEEESGIKTGPILLVGGSEGDALKSLPKVHCGYILALGP